MKRLPILTAVLIAGFCINNVAAQTTRSNTTTPATTSKTAGTTSATASVTPAPTKAPSKTEQKIDNVDSTLTTSQRLVDKTQKTIDDIFKRFPSKEPNEAFILIPAIEFDDANLEMLVKEIKDQKGVKKTSVEYENGAATIHILMKQKAEADFWSDLSKEVKDVFKMKSKKDNSILVEYKVAGAAKN